eukprot:scaffold7381_cov310-Pinguiococcus_pyrenoidosus.AAC.135
MVQPVRQCGGSGKQLLNAPLPQPCRIERESRKPVRERRPLPQEPSLCQEVPGQPADSPSALVNPKKNRLPSEGGSGQMDAATLQRMNDAAQQQFNSVALVACPNCSRTFNPERLEV